MGRVAAPGGSAESDQSPLLCVANAAKTVAWAEYDMGPFVPHLGLLQLSTGTLAPCLALLLESWANAAEPILCLACSATGTA